MRHERVRPSSSGGHRCPASRTLTRRMVKHRNERSRPHHPIEDPVRDVHNHKGCVITHREGRGLDTARWPWRSNTRCVRHLRSPRPNIVPRKRWKLASSRGDGHLVLGNTATANSATTALGSASSTSFHEERRGSSDGLVAQYRHGVRKRLITSRAGRRSRRSEGNHAQLPLIAI